MAITKKQIAKMLIEFKKTIPLFDRHTICPFSKTFNLTTGCQSLCRVVFPNIKEDHYCPCCQYKQLYTQKVVRKFIKDNK